MSTVHLSDLGRFINELVQAAGMSAANAEIFTDVYMRATLRGVGHHDIYDLPDRLAAFRNNSINPNPVIQRSGSFEALERYDGGNGPGELCSAFIMARGEELAAKHGIGLCTIRNSNHFLGSAPYLEKAAENGYCAMIFSRNKTLSMGMPGNGIRLIGNSPIGFSSATDKDYPLLLDICLAYSSFGTLDSKIEAGERVPAHWGGDAKGNPTTDPAVIASEGVLHPIGEHKGFGLAMLVEILTGVMSGGRVINEPTPASEKGNGVHSQTAIVIKADGLIPMEQYKRKVSDMIDRLDALSPGLHIPGRRSHQSKAESMRAGSIALKPGLIDQLNEWAGKLEVRPL